VKFTKEIEKYLIKELKKGAAVGPFHENPFDHGIIIFPLITVPKKDSLERCVILDLSAAGGTAVNESRLKEMLSAVVEWDNQFSNLDIQILPGFTQDPATFNLSTND
jgi:hypothetical protein